MRTCSVRTDELDLFLEAAGSMRPDYWCFVAEKQGRPVGRVAFRTLPGMEKRFALVLLDVTWEGDYLWAWVHACSGTCLKRRAGGAPGRSSTS